MEIKQFLTDYHQHESERQLSLLFKLALSAKSTELSGTQIIDLITFYENLHQLLQTIYKQNQIN